MWGHYGSKLVGILSRPFNKTSNSTSDILWWYKFFSMEDYAPFAFLRSWAMVALYLCSKFHIFDKFILEKYVF
jgi:hypothetical protein